MNRQTRLYNVIFPIWLLILFPQVWLVILPGNLAIDCLALFLTLRALKHPDKKAVMKRLWWRFWLLGFLADFVGVAWMILGWVSSLIPSAAWQEWWNENMSYTLYNCFRSPVAFLWTLAGVVLAGVCIYFFDRRAMRSCTELTIRQRHVIALTMAIATAPWLFFIPMY